MYDLMLSISFDVTLTNRMPVYGSGENKGGVYGTVACIFLYQGSYAFGWSTLLVMYPPEVLNYSLRANGMSIYTFASNAAATVVTFAFPFALAKIGWKTYMINASWDVLEIAFIIFYWVETSGKTLEEVDELIDGEYHSSAPVLMGVIMGETDVEVKEGLGIKVIELSKKVGESSR